MATIIDDANVNIAWIGNSWSVLHDDFVSSLDLIPDTYDACITADTPSSHASTKNGLYGVSLDNGEIQYFSGYALDGEYQATLYATSALEHGRHELRLSNENDRNIAEYPDYIWFDIDSIALTGSLTDASAVASDPSSSSAAPSSVSSNGPIQSSSSTTGSSSSTEPPAASASDSVSANATSTTAAAISVQYSNSISITIVSTSQIPTVDTISSPSPFTMTKATPTSSASQAEATETGSASDAHKTTTMAVSISVIAVSGIVVLSIIAWYLWRRRKRRQEDEYEDDARGHLTPQSSWR